MTLQITALLKKLTVAHVACYKTCRLVGPTVFTRECPWTVFCCFPADLPRHTLFLSGPLSLPTFLLLKQTNVRAPGYSNFPVSTLRWLKDLNLVVCLCISVSLFCIQLIFRPEDESSTFLRNICKRLLDCMALHPLITIHYHRLDYLKINSVHTVLMGQ
jgi:hypothetical protein